VHRRSDHKDGVKEGHGVGCKASWWGVAAGACTDSPLRLSLPAFEWGAPVALLLLPPAGPGEYYRSPAPSGPSFTLGARPAQRSSADRDQGHSPGPGEYYQ
jgi:hypothetical protein